MDKKGMALETVVTAILALIVLIVLAYIFRDQIGSAANRIFKIGEEGEKGARGQICVSLVTSTSRQCSSKLCSEIEKGTWREIYPSGDTFEDCKTKHCCERIDTGGESEEEIKEKDK